MAPCIPLLWSLPVFLTLFPPCPTQESTNAAGLVWITGTVVKLPCPTSQEIIKWLVLYSLKDESEKVFAIEMQHKYGWSSSNWRVEVRKDGSYSCEVTK